MHGGGAGAPADIDERIGEMRAHGLGVRARPREQTPPSGGRERHRDLQLGIVTASRALVGLRPAMIEDVFAARMRFHVARHGAQEFAAGVLGNEVHGLPAGARADRLRQLQRGEEVM